MVQTAWSTELCVCLHKLKAIERGVKLLQSPSESVATQEAVMLMFLAMHKHRQLPTKELIKAGIQEQLAVFVTTSGRCQAVQCTFCVCLHTAKVQLMS